jgi:hypothetical protein
MQGPDHRYHGDDVSLTRTRNANGGCGWPEERTAEMDTLFPGCDKHSFSRELERV